MKKTFTTQEAAIEFIEQANELLGFDDGNGTEVYAELTQITEILGEYDEVVDSYYEIPITTELHKLLEPELYDEEGLLITEENERSI